MGVGGRLSRGKIDLDEISVPEPAAPSGSAHVAKQPAAPSASHHAAVLKQSDKARADYWERRAKDLEERNGVMTIPVDLVDESPYQPRLRAGRQHDIEELEKSLKAQGQQEPVWVRKVGERYELLAGHRRRHAALSIKLPELKAVLLECDDRQAYLLVTTSAHTSKNTYEYEKAKSFKDAMERLGLKATEVADLYACSRARVSQLLKLLELPTFVLDILDEAPYLLGTDRAKEVLELLEQYPGEQTLLEEAIRKLEATPKLSLTSYVVGKLRESGKYARPSTPRSRVIRDTKGREIGAVAVKNGLATVRLAKGIDEAKFAAALNAALSKLDLDAL